MFEMLFEPMAWPFSLALAVTLGLFVLEIASLLVGMSVLGIGAEGPDVDIDADFDLSADMDLGQMTDVEMTQDMAHSEPSGFVSWIGARDVPFLVWLVSFLSLFGLLGLMFQSLAQFTLGAPLHALLAALLVVMPALSVTRIVANWTALLMPKTETSAMRLRFLGGHRGVISQGTAARGKPAEAKIQDRHGNFHYLRVEPYDDDATFAQGSDVTLIRKKGDQFFVI